MAEWVETGRCYSRDEAGNLFVNISFSRPIDGTDDYEVRTEQAPAQY